MKVFVIALSFWILIYPSFGNVFPGEIWSSGRIDLGNGGDKIFYILFKARNRNSTAPLILYMAGGPGTSGEYNILLENGPYIVNKGAQFVRNDYAWNNQYDMLFIDQPVGVGFSKAKDYESSCKDKMCVVDDVYKFLRGFYNEYPEYRNRPFYISGVSYAGHYVPGVSAHLIRKADPIINFKGAIIGGPWIDAEIQMYLDAYYLYDKKRFNIFEYLFFTFTGLVCRMLVVVDREHAYDLCSAINSQKDRYAALANEMNIESKEDYGSVVEEVVKFWNDEKTQRELGVYKEKYEIRNVTAGALLRRYDWLVRYSYDVAFVLDSGYPVTLMVGDLDYTCQYFGSLAVSEQMKWHGSKEFLNSKWELPFIGVKKRKGGNFTFYKVDEAGHLIPRDQPEVALKLLDEFISVYP